MNPIKSLLFALLLFVPSAVWAKTLEVALPDPPSYGDSLPFSVVEVVDARTDTTQVGTARTGFFNRQTPAVLRGGVRASLLKYLSGLAPEQPGREPVVVVVKQLEIKERAEIFGEYARADIAIEFAHKTAKGLMTEYSTSVFVERSSQADATRFHGENVAECLNQAVKLYLRERFPGTSMIAKLDQRLGPPRTVFMGNFWQGTKAKGIGLELLQYRPEAEGWNLLPFLRLEAPILNLPAGTTGGFSIFTISANALGPNWSNGWRPSVTAGLPLGYESLRKAGGAKHSSFFTGLILEQVMLRLPQNSSGLVLQAGFRESVLWGSTLYPYDLGVQGGGGWQF